MSFAENRVAKGYARLGRIVKITGMIGRGRTLPDRLPDSRRKNIHIFRVPHGALNIDESRPRYTYRRHSDQAARRTYGPVEDRLRALYLKRPLEQMPDLRAQQIVPSQDTNSHASIVDI